MTVGSAIVVVAALYVLDRHGLLKKTLKVAAVSLAVVGLGYGAFIGWIDLGPKWTDHQYVKSHEFVPAPQPSPKVLSYGEEYAPVTSAPEFAFRPLGNKEYVKAICYDETTGRAASIMEFANKTSSCAETEILMAEVK